MEKYTKIIEYLNSSDPETIIIGLQYLKELNIKFPQEIFRRDKNIRTSCDEIIHNIIYNVNSIYWKISLDILINKIITYSPASCACNFFKYKFKIIDRYNRYN